MARVLGEVHALPAEAVAEARNLFATGRFLDDVGRLIAEPSARSPGRKPAGARGPSEDAGAVVDEDGRALLGNRF